MIEAKAITLCFTTFAFFLKFRTRTHLQDLQPYLISETGLKFLISTQGKIDPGSLASPLNYIVGSCEEAPKSTIRCVKNLTLQKTTCGFIRENDHLP